MDQTEIILAIKAIKNELRLRFDAERLKDLYYLIDRLELPTIVLAQEPAVVKR